MLLLVFQLYCVFSHEGSLFDLDMDELLGVKIAVASRGGDSFLDAPSSVTVITREEMMVMGVEYLETLLNMVPGFQATRDVSQGSGFKVASRGIGAIT